MRHATETLEVSFFQEFMMLERAKGIEPSYAAWEAAVLPLNYARKINDLALIEVCFVVQLSCTLLPTFRS